MCEEMKRADEQIDIQKADFMCYFRFCNIHIFISVFLSIYYMYSDVSSGILISRMWYNRPNAQKNQVSLNLKWLESALSAFSSNIEVVNLKIFGP